MKSQDLRVLLADDHAMVREALARILNESPGIKVVGQAGTGPEAVRLASSLRPDLVLLDYSMPETDTPAVIRSLRGELPDAKILILTIHENVHYAIKSLEGGAHGYVMKSAAVRELLDAIKAVRLGGTYVSPSLSESVREQAWRPQKRTMGLGTLTQREFAVLRALGAGKSLKECARTLGIRASTAATYRFRLMEKLKLQSTADLIRFALENDVVG